MLASLFDVLSSASVSTQPDGSLLLQSSYPRIGAWLLAFLILAPTSLVLLRKGRLVRFAVAGLVGSLAILIVVLPAVIIEKVAITPNRLTSTEGFWFSPTHCDLDLEGLSSIHEYRVKGKFGQPKVSWLLEWRDGRRFDLVLPDLLAPNQDLVINYLQDQGIHVSRGSESAPGEEPASSFAAIAYSRETGKYGYASECKTRDEAEREALPRCSGHDARIVGWVHNGFCALAVDEKGAPAVGWSAGKDASRTAAKDHALSECKKRGDKARLLICVCSFTREPEVFD